MPSVPVQIAWVGENKLKGYDGEQNSSKIKIHLFAQDWNDGKEKTFHGFTERRTMIKQISSKKHLFFAKLVAR